MLWKNLYQVNDNTMPSKNRAHNTQSRREKIIKDAVNARVTLEFLAF